MKNISDKIFESFSAKDMSKLEELAYDIVKKYDNIFFNCPIEEKYKPKFK